MLLETSLPQKCQTKLSCYHTDQKQAENKNLYMFFLVVMSLLACIWVPPPPYTGDVIFEWLLMGTTHMSRMHRI